MAENTELYLEAIRLFGKSGQVKQAIEEMSELITAMLHFSRGKADKKDVLTEVVDVSIMLEQIKLIFDIEEDEFKKEREQKLYRLERLINNTEPDIEEIKARG